jgi:hypothetical protein
MSADTAIVNQSARLQPSFWSVTVSPLPNAPFGGYRAFVTAKMAVHWGNPGSMSWKATNELPPIFAAKLCRRRRHSKIMPRSLRCISSYRGAIISQ